MVTPSECGARRSPDARGSGITECFMAAPFSNDRAHRAQQRQFGELGGSVDHHVPPCPPFYQQPILRRDSTAG